MSVSVSNNVSAQQSAEMKQYRRVGKGAQQAQTDGRARLVVEVDGVESGGEGEGWIRTSGMRHSRGRDGVEARRRERCTVLSEYCVESR